MAEKKAKRTRTVEPTLEDAHEMGGDMMNRSSNKMGAIQLEDRRFCDMFGDGGLVALAACSWLNCTNLLPECGTFILLLWTLCFLKAHPTEAPLSRKCVEAQTRKQFGSAFGRSFLLLPPSKFVW